MSNSKECSPARQEVAGSSSDGDAQGGRARHALAWPGWKQTVISLKMEPARLGNSRFKKGCVKCVLLSYPSTELEATLTV